MRDFLAAEALGARAVLVGTAWTVQSSAGVQRVEPRAPAAVADALRAALAGPPPAGGRAVKIGMVATPAVAAAIAEALAGFDGPVVFDPVLAASSGGALFVGPDGAPLGGPDGAPAPPLPALLPLLRRATVVTPNLAEAARLTGAPVRDLAEARAAARALRGAGARAALVKGGHLEGDAADLLLSEAGERLFVAPRLEGASPRGTGCALATALAVALAGGAPLDAAVEAAKGWLFGRIRDARDRDGERLL